MKRSTRYRAKYAKIPPFQGFGGGSEPVFLDQPSILRARSAARSATRRVAAPLENFGPPKGGNEDFSMKRSTLRSSTGKTKVGLLLELSIMVPSIHPHSYAISIY